MRLSRLVWPVAATLALMTQGASAQDPVLPGGWTTRAAEVPVTYKIDVELVETGVDDGVRLVGDETIFWKNTSQEAVKVLYLHTYANAFRNTRSTFLREAMKDGLELPQDMRFSDLKFTRVSTHDEELLPKWVSPDDGNPDDRTVARIDLGSAVEAGAKLALRIGFTLEMPRVLRRMGTKNGFVMAAQWFPKLGRHVGRDSRLPNVRDGWYCHQYHASCEFAADFADYEVTLKFPSEFKVGATGVPDGDDARDPATGAVTRRYRAQSVVDFAWTADKRFEIHEFDVTPVDPANTDDPVSVEWQRRRLQRNESAADAALPSVKVVILVQPEHADQVPRMREAARVALGFFGTWLGPYPFSRLTIVDPPWNGSGAGGMEYPMLVTAGTVAGSLRISQRPEHVTVHEICHQWLMGVIASNEAEDAWLDEGMTTYLTALAMDLGSRDPAAGFSGPSYQTTDVLGLHAPYAPFFEFPGISAGWPEALGLPKWLRPAKIESLKLWRDLPNLSYVSAPRYGVDPMLPLRRSYLRRAGVDEMVKSGWMYADRTSYAVNAYSRPALFLSSLRRSLASSLGADKGDAAFFKALRDYAREYRFRHPTTDDFMRRWKESAADPGPLAAELVRSAATFDYLVKDIRSANDPKLVGFDEKGVPARPVVGDDDAPKSSIVRVERRGGPTLPVTLMVTRRDGTTERVVWEAKDQAKDRWRDFRFDGDVTVARIDPDRLFLQDTDLSNNGFAKETDARPAVKWSVRFVSWLENAMLSYGRFF